MTELGGRRGQLARSGLRPGWTTGACAGAAARAAWTALLTGSFPDPVPVELPLGRTPEFALTSWRLLEGQAEASVTKDAGDDPDVTHAAVIRVRVRRGAPGTGVRFEAGPGVGTVTLPGLPLPVGEPAINPMPRAMIVANVRSAAGVEGSHPDPDVVVTVGIDGGEALAARTLNARVGVLGGLSVLGTTGVVVPYSCSAWIDSIRSGIDVARATGHSELAACTGSTSERVARDSLGLPDVALIDMGDFVGAVLTHLRKHPVSRLHLVGGVAKFAKLASGHLDLHSARSRVDTDQLARLATDAGADDSLAARVLAASTALDAVTLCEQDGVHLGAAIADAACAEALRVLDGAPVAVDVICVDRSGAVLGRSRT